VHFDAIYFCNERAEQLCLARMDESVDGIYSRICKADPQSDWQRPAGRPHTSWLATEERPIMSQPQCGRCHRAGTGQPTLKTGGYRQQAELYTEMVQNRNEQ